MSNKKVKQIKNVGADDPVCQKNKGITLIALVITIVVLLILAIVSIQLVINGEIVKHAQDAGSKYSEAQIKEKLDLAISEAYITGKGKITESDLRNALISQFGDDFTLNSNGENYTVEISGKQYTISSTGSISEYEEKLERIYYATKVGDNNVWADGYVVSEKEIPEGATITAKLYKTNTPFQPALPEHWQGEVVLLEEGYAYKLVIDGEGEMPAILDPNNEICAAWGEEIIAAQECNWENIIYYLTEAEINGVSNVASGAFAYVCCLNTCLLGDSITSIGSNAFIECGALQNINIENITDIGQFAFSATKSLKNITLSEDITTIYANTFPDSAIETINLDNVTKIEEGAFYGCENLTNVELSDDITELGEEAFRDCNALQSIDLKNVTQIGQYAFDGCNNLKTVKIKASTFEVGYRGFYNIASGSKIYVLNEEVKNALEGKYDSNKTTVEIKTLEEMEQL